MTETPRTITVAEFVDELRRDARRQALGGVAYDRPFSPLVILAALNVAAWLALVVVLVVNR